MFYSPSRNAMFASPIGEDSVEITDDRHNTVLAEMAQGRVLVAGPDGMPMTKPFTPVELTLDQQLNGKLSALIVDFEYAANTLRGKYPTTETSTWTMQIDQARAYQKWVDAGKEGDKPATPFLDALSAARDELGVGNGFDDLVAAIFDNNNTYVPAMAMLTAKKQAADKAIHEAYATGNSDLLKNDTWNFGASQPAVAS